RIPQNIIGGAVEIPLALVPSREFPSLASFDQGDRIPIGLAILQAEIRAESAAGDLRKSVSGPAVRKSGSHLLESREESRGKHYLVAVYGARGFFQTISHVTHAKLVASQLSFNSQIPVAHVRSPHIRIDRIHGSGLL